MLAKTNFIYWHVWYRIKRLYRYYLKPLSFSSPTSNHGTTPSPRSGLTLSSWRSHQTDVQFSKTSLPQRPQNHLRQHPTHPQSPPPVLWLTVLRHRFSLHIRHRWRASRRSSERLQRDTVSDQQVQGCRGVPRDVEKPCRESPAVGRAFLHRCGWDDVNDCHGLCWRVGCPGHHFPNLQCHCDVGDNPRKQSYSRRSDEYAGSGLV